MAKVTDTLDECMDDIDEVQVEFVQMEAEKQLQFILHVQKFASDMTTFAEAMYNSTKIKQ